MARRKNTKFVDPRYFMDEKTERLNEGVLDSIRGGFKKAFGMNKIEKITVPDSIARRTGYVKNMQYDADNALPFGHAYNMLFKNHPTLGEDSTNRANDIKPGSAFAVKQHLAKWASKNLSEEEMNLFQLYNIPIDKAVKYIEDSVEDPKAYVEGFMTDAESKAEAALEKLMQRAKYLQPLDPPRGQKQ